MLAALALTVALALPAQAAAAVDNPCESAEARLLRCPNLRIAAPSEIYAQAVDGHVLLRATSNVESRGKGPMELHGRRDGPRSMKVNQWIYRKGGGHIVLPTEAKVTITARRRKAARRR